MRGWPGSSPSTLSGEPSTCQWASHRRTLRAKGMILSQTIHVRGVQAGAMMWVAVGLGAGPNLNVSRLWEFICRGSCLIWRPWEGLSSVEWEKCSEGSGQVGKVKEGCGTFIYFNWVCTQGLFPGKKEKISAEEHVAAQESSVLKLREDSPKAGSSRSLCYSLSPSLQPPWSLLWPSQFSQQGQPFLLL